VYACEGGIHTFPTRSFCSKVEVNFCFTKILFNCLDYSVPLAIRWLNLVEFTLFGGSVVPRLARVTLIVSNRVRSGEELEKQSVSKNKISFYSRCVYLKATPQLVLFGVNKVLPSTPQLH